jgi:Restriction endonuclease
MTPGIDSLVSTGADSGAWHNTAVIGGSLESDSSLALGFFAIADTAVDRWKAGRRNDATVIPIIYNELTALVSPHPYDLEPVRPLVNFDSLLARFKFVAGADVIAGLDSRPDLLAMSPFEFEIFVKQLFEAMGMKAWKTQDVKDDGVDAVAVSEAPVFGGLCVIQAKRSRYAVGIDVVRAGRHHGRQARHERRCRHYVLGHQGRPRLCRPPRPHRDRGMRPPQVPVQGAPRPRRPHQPTETATWTTLTQTTGRHRP